MEYSDWQQEGSWRRIRLIVGGGYQRPVSPFYTFNHQWTLTARAAF
jgi:hypothetical protein